MSKALTREQRLLLLEAARRYKEFYKDGAPLTLVHTGLGTAKEYRPVEDADLMRVVPQAGKEKPNTLYWWKLTPKGAAIVRVIVSALTVSQICAEIKEAMS